MARAAMFKLLSQTTVAEDFNDDAHAATKAFGSAFAAGYNKTKGKIQSDKEKAAADAERSAKDKEAEDKKQADLDAKTKGNERLQDIVHSIFSEMRAEPKHEFHILDSNGNIKDPVWHQMTAEELAFIRKYVTRIDKTFKEFKVQLLKRLSASPFLKRDERQEVKSALETPPTEIDGKTHLDMGYVFAEPITVMLKTGNIKFGIDACIDSVKKAAEDLLKVTVNAKKAPLVVTRAMAIMGAVLNNYQDRLATISSAIDEHEFGRVLNPQEAEAKAKEQEQESKKPEPTASMKKPEPEVKEARKLVSFRPLTESEV